MSLLVDLNTEPPKLAITLIPMAVPLPLRIIGTGQFDWNLAYRNDLLGLHTAINQVSIAHNGLYHYAIDEFGAIVLQVDQMKLETVNTKSLIEQETLQRVEQNFALTQQINILSASTLETSAQIQEEKLLRADAVSALTTQLQQQVVRIDDTYAKITEESTARVAVNNALAEEIEITKTSLQGHIAQVEVTTQSSIDTINGELQAISASYGVKLTVDGLVGGFYVNNDGEFVEASFDLDNFYIGRGTTAATKPFALVNNLLYLNNTRITFDWLRSTTGETLIEGNKIKTQFLNVQEAQSANYAVNSAGWRLAADGNAYLNNAVMRGSIKGGAYTGYAWPAAGAANIGYYLGAEGLLLGNANNGKYVQITTDGNFYMPGMTVENGVMSISALNVINTINIAGQAVTTLASMSSTYKPSTYSMEGTITIYCAGVSLLLIGSGSGSLGGTPEGLNSGSISLNIYRDGATVWASSLAGAGGVDISASCVDTPSTGWHTYKFKITVYGNNGVGAPSIVYGAVFEAKR